jgi:CO/xanthine dehydrogenase FAD-binding subunit
MNLWQQYLSPRSIPEAILALTSAPGPVIPIAGGTDLLLDLQQGRHTPVYTLVDLTSVPELTRIEERDGKLFIGAAAPLNRIARHPLVAEHAQALVEACDLVGGPQVRNVATLGGNVAHALPAADGTIALLARDAEAEIADATGARRVPLSDLFIGPGKSSLKHGEELLTGFYLSLMKAHQASCFKRIMRPQGVALPIINLAVRISRDGEVIRDVRIAVGPGAAVPWRAQQAEHELIGKQFAEQTIGVAQEALLAHVGFRSSPRRASADYRRHLVGALFRETLEAAWQRAK